jgi:hypothetical protein
MNGYKINSIETLCSFIMTEKPELKKVNELLWHLCIKAIILDEAEAEPETYCNLIKDYWQRWQHIRERPIFMNIDLDIRG